MASEFTQPDPLDNSAVTLSIYITELQDCVNTRRDEIGQSAITNFINQAVGKIFVLDSIEQLKTLVNQLALDFGFTGGVTNAELLGRPYVEITKLFGKEVAHFPIINDLRQVLEALFSQFLIIPIIEFPSDKYALTTELDDTDTFIDVNAVSATTSSRLPVHAINVDGSYVTTGFAGGPLRILTTIRDEAAQTLDTQEDEDFSVSVDICADSDFVYLVSNRISDNKIVIVKYDKDNRSTGESLQSIDLEALDPVVGGATGRRGIVNDETSIFISGETSDTVLDDGINVQNAIIQEFNKGASLSFAGSKVFQLDIIEDSDFIPLFTAGFIMITERRSNLSTLAIDTNNMYGFYQESAIGFYDGNLAFSGVSRGIPTVPGDGSRVFVFDIPLPSFYVWNGSIWVAVTGAFSTSLFATALVKFGSHNIVIPTILQEVFDNTFNDSSAMCAQLERLYILGEDPQTNELTIRDTTSGNIITGFDIIGRVGEGLGLKTVKPATGIFNSQPNNISSVEEFKITITSTP